MKTVASQRERVNSRARVGTLSPADLVQENGWLDTASAPKE